MQRAQLFGKVFDNVCDNLEVSANSGKKPLCCNVDFLGLEFDILLIEAWLPKDKLQKAIEEVATILRKKSWTTNEELDSLVGLHFFAANIVCPGRAFLLRLYDRVAKGKKYLHWSKSIGDDLL